MRMSSTPDIETLQLDCQDLLRLQADGRYYEIYECMSRAINGWLNRNIGQQKTANQRVTTFGDQLNDKLIRCSEYLAKTTGASVDGRCAEKIYSDRCFYIPLLRGIENFDSYFDKTVLKPVDEALLNRKQWQAVDNYAKNSGHIYEEKVSKVYGIDKSCIFTAENLCDEVRKKLLGLQAQREQIKDFQEFISENFYGGDGFTLIPRQVSNGDGTCKEHLNVKIGKSEERPLHDLGDGIKQIITILYKIYEKKDEEAIFLIEEPEINLHPGYQKKLMKILQSDVFDKHQFFIVTHSNHVLESFSNFNDVSVYKVTNMTKRNNLFKVVRTNAKDSDILDLLGISNMSVMLANCSIFVEGLSDKILIQRYLEIYFEKHGYNFQEGVNYAFIETGGGCISHWDFMKDLSDDDIDKIRVSDFSNHSFIVCDGDGGKKKERKEKLKAMVGEDNFLELPVREIENTLKRSVLEKVLFGSQEVVVKKNYNENNASGYYNQRYIGKFIDAHYELSKKYAAQSGTIKGKIQFSKDAICYINTYEDLTDAGIELCEKLTNFIEKANS